jgi:hypothetical protein
MFCAKHLCAPFLICFSLSFLSNSPFAHAQGSAGYPGVFDTNQMLNLNLTMTPGNFSTILNDETFAIEVPAQFSADGESSISVMVRRKSGDWLNGKVSYKIDINDLVNGQKWNSLTKLSLENGDDADVVSEGLSWYMHRAAAGNMPNYSPGMAAWTTLSINGASQGVYLNVEQPNKQFLRNRSLWEKDETWLFKQSDVASTTYKEGPTQVSPTMQALNFSPFADGTPPQGQALQTILNDNIDMEAMLTLGAVNAFTGNPDELFSKGKNFYWADFAPPYEPANTEGKRTYFPWDLDASIRQSNLSIYGTRRGNKIIHSEYQEVILNDPVFRTQYNNIMLSLLAGPLSVASLTAFLDDMEPVITAPLEADANNNIGGSVAGHFDSLRQWVIDRHDNIHQQLLADIGSGGVPGDFNFDGAVDGFDFLKWQRGESPNVLSQSDLAELEVSYGLILPISTISTALPEPSTMTLLGLGGILALRRFRATAFAD